MSAISEGSLVQVTAHVESLGLLQYSPLDTTTVTIRKALDMGNTVLTECVAPIIPDRVTSPVLDKIHTAASSLFSPSVRPRPDRLSPKQLQASSLLLSSPERQGLMGGTVSNIIISPHLSNNAVNIQSLEKPRELPAPIFLVVVKRFYVQRYMDILGTYMHFLSL